MNVTIPVKGIKPDIYLDFYLRVCKPNLFSHEVREIHEGPNRDPWGPKKLNMSWKFIFYYIYIYIYITTSIYYINEGVVENLWSWNQKYWAEKCESPFENSTFHQYISHCHILYLKYLFTKTWSYILFICIHYHLCGMIWNIFQGIRLSDTDQHTWSWRRNN